MQLVIMWLYNNSLTETVYQSKESYRIQFYYLTKHANFMRLHDIIHNTQTEMKPRFFQMARQHQNTSGNYVRSAQGVMYMTE